MTAYAPQLGRYSLSLLVALWAAGIGNSLPLAGQSATAPAPVVSWAPGEPVQGRLFRLVVEFGPETGLAGVEGEVGGEVLHFEGPVDGRFEAIAGVPIDAVGELTAALRFRYADGRTETTRTGVPVAPGSYRHEELTVAPRFGSPPSDEDQARRARDAAKARAVSAEAHRTPRLWNGTVAIPREDRVTSGFGNGRVFNGQVSSRHMGLDLDGEPGDTVYAAARGVVQLVDEFLLAGNIVYLNHGAGLISGYFHLSEQLVAEGDTVVAGTPIGRVGATGRVTGPHLHWVVRYGTTSLDPRSLLEALPASAAARRDPGG
jgi:murein DD-endopeptidase MepM/ murein hydrolase activator NlpD